MTFAIILCFTLSPQLTTDVFYPRLSFQSVTDGVERNCGDGVGTVEVGVAGKLQLKQDLLVESFVVAVQLGSLGIFRFVSVTQLLSFSGVPSIRDAADKDIQEGETFQNEILRVKSTAGL